MQDKIFWAVVFGFILGVLTRSFILVNFYSALFVGVIGVLILLLSFTVVRNRWVIVLAVFLVLFSLGILRFNSGEKALPWYFESKVEQEVSLTGVLIDEPQIRETNQKVAVLVREGADKTKILITTDFTNEYKYGDKVSFTGKLQKPENFETDQGKEFDYINYLGKDDIQYLVYYPEIQVGGGGYGNPIKSALFSAKQKFLKVIKLSIYEPESLLMGGLILGERASFSAEMRERFINTGTIHIVALSGYNVSIVADWIMRLFSFLPRNMGFGAGILGIILFVIMAGGQSTAVRAGIMAILVLIARATGRTYDVARGLALAGVIMILINPYVLRYDVSFQLSFIATVAVIYLAPKFETSRHFTWITKKFELRNIIATTCAAYLFVLPFILYKMGNLSLTALPANFLILPFIPPTMILGFITGFIGLLWWPLAVPFGYLSYGLLHYELKVIEILANIPFSSFTIPNFPLILVLAIYAYFIYRLFGRSIKGFFVE